MKYYITIDHTSNDNKTGKLTIKSVTGRVVLDKVPVVVPNQTRNIIISKGGDISLDNYRIRNVITVLSNDLQKSSKYKDEVELFEHFKLNDILYIDKQYAIISNSEFNKTSDSFVLRSGDYNKLKSILDSTSVFDIKIKQKFFMFGLEDVGEKTPLLNTSITLSKLEKGQIVLDSISSEIKKSEEANKNLVTNNVLSANKVYSDVKNQKDESKKDSSPLNSIKNNTKSIINGSTNKSSDDIDALDILFMYHSPELAPFFKPNSILAWALYFDHQKNDISLVDMKNNLNDVQGFEDVAGTSLKYTSTGYEIQMFDDVNKQSLAGVLIYNSKDNTFTMESPDSNVNTTMTISEKGDVVGVFNGEKGVINYDLVRKPDGVYTGNWESIDTDGVKVVSAVEFSKDLYSSSTPSESVDIAHIKNSRDEYIDNLKYENNNDDIAKWHPPPPPPPPKEDEYGWSSSNDSYNNSSSFSP